MSVEESCIRSYSSTDVPEHGRRLFAPYVGMHRSERRRQAAKHASPYFGNLVPWLSRPPF